jgi:uncharacterized protein with PIN domain
MKVARFRFDAGLRSLLQRDHALGEFDYRFSGPQSAKHLIEAVGIPHTEVGSLTARSVAVTLAYLVQDGDTLDILGPSPEDIPDAEPRFVIDGHLGRLNSHLRMLGLDCFYDGSYADPALAQLSVDQGRFLLTRDRRLLMYKSITRGYLLRSLDPALQLREVVRRYGLLKWMRPFQRCIRCNHLLEIVDKAQILDRLEPLTKLYFDDFRICPACNQIYWKGSHFERMQILIGSLDKL